MYQVPSNTYDVVIVGGGHNGLVAACYLARAGYSVCILERYKDVGGAAFSEEIEGAPGHIASTGSYVLSLAPQKELHDPGLQNLSLITPHYFTRGRPHLRAAEDESLFVGQIDPFAEVQVADFIRHRQTIRT